MSELQTGRGYRTSRLAYGMWTIGVPQIASFLRLAVRRTAFGGLNEAVWKSVHRPERCVVRELPDNTGNPAPRRRAIVITVGRELVGARDALLEGLLAVALEHQGGSAPDIDLGYHATNTAGLRV
jgi:hypothetical protein